MVVSCGVGTTYPSGEPEITPQGFSECDSIIIVVVSYEFVLNIFAG